MNSDPYDSAAWRTFAMLAPDEAKRFDDAMHQDETLRAARLEMDRLSAAVALATTQPAETDPGELERLQGALGFNRAAQIRRVTSAAGWLTATCLAAALIYQNTREAPAPPPAAGTAATGTPPAPPVELERLQQEITFLRESLSKYQTSEQALFAPVPGMAMPVVMILTPPGADPGELTLLQTADGLSPITELLGDALSATTWSGTLPLPADEIPPEAAETTLPSAPESNAAHAAARFPPLPDYPVALPIYDSARDAGTLVVSKLPPVDEGESYNLWVRTQPGSPPVFVGSLPKNSAAGADAFDFSLGSTMIRPAGFMLSRDPSGTPPPPAKANAVLSGPPALDR